MCILHNLINVHDSNDFYDLNHLKFLMAAMHLLFLAIDKLIDIFSKKKFIAQYKMHYNLTKK